MTEAVFLPAVLLPFAGTLLGVLLIMFADRYLNLQNMRYLHAASAGVMTAASFFSLLLPSIETAGNTVPWLPAVSGFLLGGLSLFLIEKAMDTPQSKKDGRMLMLAVTLHNFPEGMAVGVALAGLFQAEIVSLSGALMLSLGIAIQNIPEGAIIYAPLYAGGASRKKAFTAGLLSGLVEPVGAVIAFGFTSLFTPILPYILSFTAGAMIFVAADEMIPASKEGTSSSLPAVLFIASFAAMMLLDVAFG